MVPALAASRLPGRGDIDLIVHGTTTTTNAVLERRLAKTGMITTRGFRDVIELGRRTRPQAYGMTGSLRARHPARSAARSVRAHRGVRHACARRSTRRGARGASPQLLDAGCESLVIHFLHSYANPAHERRAAEIAAELWPNGYITIGHALLSEAREFERGVTASVNAAVQPILERYVERLRSELGGARLFARLPDHERQWRHDLGPLRHARSGQDRDVGAGVRRHRRRLYRTARRLPTTSSPTTWAAPRPMSR